MFNRIKHWIREQIAVALVENLSIERLRRIASKFDYELRRKRKWTDPYENHPPTFGGTFQVKEGAFNVLGATHDFTQEDEAAIRKLLKSLPKNPKAKIGSPDNSPPTSNIRPIN